MKHYQAVAFIVYKPAAIVGAGFCDGCAVKIIRGSFNDGKVYIPLQDAQIVFAETDIIAVTYIISR